MERLRLSPGVTYVDLHDLDFENLLHSPPDHDLVGIHSNVEDIRIQGLDTVSSLLCDDRSEQNRVWIHGSVLSVR